MPKVAQRRANGASRDKPYAAPVAKTKVANNIFRMNTDLGYVYQSLEVFELALMVLQSAYP
jgi:hypothetical protein